MREMFRKFFDCFFGLKASETEHNLNRKPFFVKNIKNI